MANFVVASLRHSAFSDQYSKFKKREIRGIGRSVVDTAHRNCAGLFSVVVTIHELAALAKVVKPGVHTIARCCCPEESMRLEAPVATGRIPRAPEQDIEFGISTLNQTPIRFLSVLPAVGPNSALMLCHLFPFIVGRQSPFFPQHFTSFLCRFPRIQASILRTLFN